MLEDARNDNKDTDTEHLRRRCELHTFTNSRIVSKDLTFYRRVFDMIEMYTTRSNFLSLSEALPHGHP